MLHSGDSLRNIPEDRSSQGVKYLWDINFSQQLKRAGEG
jgi:hypothetical protein